MAGAGYKLFNTGDVLTAQQVNEYLMQQTVMVFADASARTTALSGVLAEGMISYLKSTDATEVYNGSAWVGIAADQTPLTTKGDLFTYTTTDARLASSNVNGDVLTVDTSTASGLKWATPATGGITLISSQTPSAVTSVTFSSIPGTYKDLILTWGNVFHSTTGSYYDVRFNNSSASNYYINGLQYDLGVAQSYLNQLSYATGLWSFGYDASDTSIHLRSNGMMRIYDYASTTLGKNYEAVYGYFRKDQATNIGNYQGFFNDTTAITSLNIIRFGGSATLSTGTNGYIRLYGVS